MRWMLVFLIACLLFSRLQDVLRRLGLGKLPGDFHWKIRGRDYYVPVASSLLLSFIVTAIGSLI